MRRFFGPREPAAAVSPGAAAPAGELPATSGAAGVVLEPAARRLAGPAYDERARREVEHFTGTLQVNDLPAIFHYWSNRHLRPRFEALGYTHPEDFFAREIEAFRRRAGRPLRAISIGAGNCDGEVRVTKLLRSRGVADVRVACLDLTPAMLERGRALARQEGVEAQLDFVQGDFNRWRPDREYDVVIANQSLHHVVNLEGLFEAVALAIGRDGVFLTSDMIGRNGHRRWPEALAVVQEFWRELPASYRHNVQLGRDEPEFLDWDCSQQSFEGIRAQDILPLLLDRFGFDVFLPFANVVDPFVDRAFGHHFSAERENDRGFIDRVHARDDAEILAGTIKPTHMVAALRCDRGVRPRIWRHLDPAFCVRWP